MTTAALLLACGTTHDDAAPPPSPTPAGDEDDVMCDPPPAANADGPVHAASAPLVNLVDPFIGSGGMGFGVGSASPAPQRPFGLARPGPDTSNGDSDLDFAHCSGYSQGDKFISGFSQTRMQGTGLPDYGAVALMPVIGMTPDKTSQRVYRSRFSHATEQAHAGYYAVKLDDTQIGVEITASEHVGFHRFTFPAGSDATVLLDVGHTIPSVKIGDGSVTIDPAAKEISGFSHFMGAMSSRFGGMDVHYVARFNRSFSKSGVWKAGALAPDGTTTAAGGDTGAWASFDTTNTAVEVAIGISFVDVAHARANLDAEIATFDAARKATEDAWESMLGKIALEGRSDRDMKIFYTALYHALLMPTLATDTDGSYRGLDKAIHHADGFRYFTDFSLWDTYRTLHPFLSLVVPDIERELLQSLVEMGKASGKIPRWPLGIGETGTMVGDSAAVVFGEGIVKGIQPVDYAGAYDLLRRAATEGREYISDYATKGYVPIETAGASAAITIEYSADDLGLASLADRLGHADDASVLRARSKSWKNLFDPTLHFLAGRHADGTFAPYSPIAHHDWYAEGDAWQYTFELPFEGDDLAPLMGGRDVMLGRLEQLFTRSACNPVLTTLPQPYYWAGNEVDLGAAWIFAAMDDWTRAARWTRWALSARYGDGFDGIPGNDDAGTMSAWYMFAASGFYPIAGTDTYLLGSPIFDKVTMHLPGGDLVIAAPGTSPRVLDVASASLNGTKLTRPRIAHADIAKGASLTFTLTPAAPQ
jgi:predicted alpha-1,2-mannosidase